MSDIKKKQIQTLGEYKNHPGSLGIEQGAATESKANLSEARNLSSLLCLIIP